MKMHKTSIFFMTILAAVLISCSSETFAPNLLTTGESGYNFVQSHKQWQNLKAKNNETYTYTMHEESFSGSGSKTTLTVIDGKVVSREYLAFTRSMEDGSLEIIQRYYETADEVGESPEGAAPLTLDELYNDCGAEYLMVDPDSHTLYFDTDESGVMSLCGNVPNLCADDCFVGFRISEFSWGPDNNVP